MSAKCQMLTLGADVSGGPSIRISLMSTEPSKRGKPSPHTPKNQNERVINVVIALDVEFLVRTPSRRPICDNPSALQNRTKKPRTMPGLYV